MTHSTELIILSLTKTRDSSAVIHTLSRDFGRKSFIVSIKKSSPLAFFLPLNIIESDIIENPKSQLWRAGNFATRHPLSGIRSNIHKNTMSLFISEVLYRTIKEGPFQDGLYEWCRDMILKLDCLEKGYSAFNTRFLVELAIELGFAPSGPDLIPFSDPDDKDGIDLMLRYLSDNLGTTLNIQSLRVLRELYNTNI